jgi:hypothetical protein
MGGGWNQGGRWGQNQSEKNYGGDRRNQEWRRHEEAGGGDIARHGGSSARNFTAPGREGCSYVPRDSRKSSPTLSKCDSGNEGAGMENIVTFLGGEDTAQTIMGRFYGDRSSFNSGGPAGDNLNKEKVMTQASPNNGKNIYVGQWDSIKEKMVWDKINDANIIKEISKGCVRPEKDKGVEIEGPDEVGKEPFIFGSSLMCANTNKAEVAIDSPSAKKWTIKKPIGKARAAGAGGGEKTGKRENYEEDVVDNLSGKRNKNVVSTGVGNSDVAAAAL